jgi:tetratricopeptide (TPR) repeat protein
VVLEMTAQSIMRRIGSLAFRAALAAALWLALPVVGQAQQGEDPVELYQRANELQAVGRYAEAIPYAHRALEIEELRSGASHPDVAYALNNLASLYHAQGRYADAEPLYKRSLVILEKALGPDHPDVAQSLSNLAGLYYAQGRYVDAEPLYKRSLAIQENALDPDPSAVAQSLTNLAYVYYLQGRYADAEPLYQRSLAILEKALGPDHRDVAQSLNDLAELYRIQGRYADAEPLLQRSLVIRENALGPDHPDVAQSLNNLASLYQYQGRYAEAEPLYQQSLMIREKALGPDHADVAQSLSNLAGLYHAQGRYADAEPLYQRSLAIRENALGPDHSDVAQSLSNLAGLYHDQGRYADAEPLLQRSLAILEALGPDHPDVAYSLNNLASLYQDQGRYADAEPLYQRSLAIREKALGPDHPDVAYSLNNLALLYQDQGRYADAEPLYQRSLMIRENALGPDHPDVAQSLNNLASLYQDQGRYADALPLVRRLMAQNAVNEGVAFAIFLESRKQNLISSTEAFSDSYNVLQQGLSSSAGEAISKLAARFAAGSDDLAKLVRKDQDLTADAERLDKTIIAAVSKPPGDRNLLIEGQIRGRVEAIKLERDQLRDIFNQRFPNYVALASPQPLTERETQALLADDEVLVAFDFSDKSYAWIITQTVADWTELKVTANELGEQVKALRSSLTFDTDKLFDTQLAYKLYLQTFGTIADKLKGKKRLSIVTNGAFTSLPLQLLITSDPSGKSLKDVDWLVRSYAITNFPSVASLKTLRSASARSTAEKPIIAFADPVFSKDPTSQVIASRSMTGQNDKKLALRSLVNFYEGSQPDLVSLAKALPQLPDTAEEVRAIAKVLS